MVLIKVVLCNIPIFWFSLAQLLVSILNSLRKLIMKFLWSEAGSLSKYHLADWESICLPKKMGGWGIKNMYWFNVALSLKTGWAALIDKGLWNSIILTKYLKRINLNDWIRYQKYRNGGGSYF